MKAVTSSGNIRNHINEHGDISKARLLKYLELGEKAFKPEMITEYFEGWEQEQPSEVDFINKKGNTRWRIIDWKLRYEYSLNREIISENQVIERNQFKLPKTLDHFIGDALRAGIELTFKPEITEKYFK